MFKKLEEDEALIVERGVYRSAALYELNGALFIQAKGGFVRAKTNGSTSHATVRLYTLMREGPLYQDRFGRLCIEDGPDRTEVELSFDGDQAVLTIAAPAAKKITNQSKE